MEQWPCDACSNRSDDIFATCTACRDLRRPDATWATGATLILLYVGDTQLDASARYRAHAWQLAPFGYRPVATSWGEQRPDAGSALFFGNLEEAYRIGTLLVTYALDGAGGR